MLICENNIINKVFFQDERIYGMFIGDVLVFLTYLIVDKQSIEITNAEQDIRINVKSNTEWSIE